MAIQELDIWAKIESLTSPDNLTQRRDLYDDEFLDGWLRQVSPSALQLNQLLYLLSTTANPSFSLPTLYPTSLPLQDNMLECTGQSINVIDNYNLFCQYGDTLPNLVGEAPAGFTYVVRNNTNVYVPPGEFILSYSTGSEALTSTNLTTDNNFIISPNFESVGISSNNILDKRFNGNDTEIFSLEIDISTDYFVRRYVTNNEGNLNQLGRVQVPDPVFSIKVDTNTNKIIALTETVDTVTFIDMDTMTVDGSSSIPASTDSDISSNDSGIFVLTNREGVYTYNSSFPSAQIDSFDRVIAVSPHVDMITISSGIGSLYVEFENGLSGAYFIDPAGAISSIVAPTYTPSTVVRDVKFSPNGQEIAIIEGDDLVILDASSAPFTEVERLDLTGFTKRCVDWDRTGTRLFVGRSNGTLLVINRIGMSITKTIIPNLSNTNVTDLIYFE